VRRRIGDAEARIGPAPKAPSSTLSTAKAAARYVDRHFHTLRVFASGTAPMPITWWRTYLSLVCDETIADLDACRAILRDYNARVR
jgi:hypothetical protein